MRKLERLPPRTRLRKLLVMIRDAEQRLAAGAPLAEGDLPPLLRSEAFLSALEPARRRDAERRLAALSAPAAEALRALDALRHAIMAELGVSWAEWDQLLPATIPRAPGPRTTFPIRVYLEDIRSPYNVGAVFRTAEAFGVEHVYLSPRTPLPTLPRARRTSRGCSDIVPWSVCDLEAIAGLARGEGAQEGAPHRSHPLRVFALETAGVALGRFEFPPAGVVLVGSEELGLSPEALELAERSAGRVSIPMVGGRASLNVAVAFGILIQAWCSRLTR